MKRALTIKSNVERRPIGAFRSIGRMALGALAVAAVCGLVMSDAPAVRADGLARVGGAQPAPSPPPEDNWRDEPRPDSGGSRESAPAAPYDPEPIDPGPEGCPFNEQSLQLLV